MDYVQDQPVRSRSAIRGMAWQEVMMSIRATPISKSAYISNRRTRVPLFLQRGLYPSSNHRQDGDVLQYCERDRSSELRDRFRGSAIWRTYYVEYERHHYANLSFFKPQPLFIAAFFFPQQLFQLGWLYRLYKLDPTKGNAERQELD
jgi:hypothetical protein